MHDKIRIDLETGLFIESVLPIEVGKDIIEIICPSGFVLPKWDGTKWVEGKTQDEIDVIKGVVPEPTLQEVVDDLIQLLVDKEVIF